MKKFTETNTLKVISDDEISPYLLDEEHAAKFLSVSKGTLCNWRSQGVGPDYVKFGPKCVRYRIEDLQSFADKHRKNPSAA